MQSLLCNIRDALTSIKDLKVYHYWRTREEAPYCVWQEESEGDSLHTGNHKTEQVITGTIDYFTKTEYDPIVDSIQDALNTVENLGWKLDSVSYEDDTGLIHYSWDWEIA